MLRAQCQSQLDADKTSIIVEDCIEARRGATGSTSLSSSKATTAYAGQLFRNTHHNEYVTAYADELFLY